MGNSGDLEGFPDHVRVRVERGLPEMPGDDNDIIVAFDGFFRKEVSSEEGLDSEDFQQVGPGDDTTDEAGMIVAEGNAYRILPEQTDVAEDRVLVVPDLEVSRIGAAIGEEFFEEADALPDDYQLSAIAVGEGLKENAIDYAEDGCGRADA